MWWNYLNLNPGFDYTTLVGKAKDALTNAGFQNLKVETADVSGTTPDDRAIIGFVGGTNNDPNFILIFCVAGANAHTLCDQLVAAWKNLHGG
jgi:hypothetical protein